MNRVTLQKIHPSVTSSKHFLEVLRKQGKSCSKQKISGIWWSVQAFALFGILLNSVLITSRAAILQFVTRQNNLVAMAKQNEVVEFVIGNYLAKKTSRKCTYCEVYTGIDQTNSKVSVEVKLCPIENGFNVKMLEYEARIRKEILKNDYLFKYLQSGTVHQMCYEVCEHPGRTLSDLHATFQKFKLATICMIEKVHKEKFLIRSISPDNIAIGLGEREKNFYILDCFLFKKYWDTRTGKHIPCIEGKAMFRDPLYASTHEHLGIESSRRDDIESLSYLTLFMLKGKLPWDAFLNSDNKKENYPNIMATKLNTTPEMMFHSYPHEFAVMLGYARALKFDEVPDYEWLKGLFTRLFNSHNYKTSIALEWVQRVDGDDDDDADEDDYA